jgi:hypothetical protein
LQQSTPKTLKGKARPLCENGLEFHARLLLSDTHVGFIVPGTAIELVLDTTCLSGELSTIKERATLQHIHRDGGASRAAGLRQSGCASAKGRVIHVTGLAIGIQANGRRLTTLCGGIKAEASRTARIAGTGKGRIVEAIEVAVRLSVGESTAVKGRVKVLAGWALIIEAEGWAANLSRGIQRVARRTALRSRLTDERSVKTLARGRVIGVAWVTDRALVRGGSRIATSRVADGDRAGGAIRPGAGQKDRPIHHIFDASVSGGLYLIGCARRQDNHVVSRL